MAISTWPISSVLVGNGSIDPLAGIGVGLMIVAFAFKVGAAPFHLAVPDAYSGSSSPIAGSGHGIQGDGLRSPDRFS
ncbi:MAG: hypothetical protein Ct9H300mP30_2130 [Methanobacteriota archaeon]|nr:MAG: hypothetical protein Ct9H300mP30_2130 [Euryarchaeota archaeon]